MGAESFTVLAILEARDRASEVFAKIDESLDRFSDTAERAAEVAKGAGDSIDESLLRTASGADALDVASARVSAAQERATRTAEQQAEAERNLLDAYRAAEGGADDDVAAQYRLMEANERMTAASKENAAAQKTLSDAQKVQSDTAAAAAAKNDAAAESQAAVSDASKESAVNLGSVGKFAGIAALGIGIAGALMVKAAANFQSSTEHLVTDAGESQKNLAMVRAGILNISTATGQSAESITNAMYHVESAGYHGAAGLGILKVAAQGALVGGADLDTVSKTLVGTLRSYGPAAGSASQVMNELIATVGQGDMRMQDLASSLSTVAPTAARAGISLAQLGGAMATMTAQGMTAQQAGQDLNAAIGSLMDPTHVQTLEMQSLGLNSNKLSTELGHQGLTATMATLTRAIASHVKGGQVWLSTYQNATVAAGDLKTMLGALPGPLQSLAKGYESGSLSAKEWRTDLQAQTPLNGHLLQQFASLADKTKSFSAQLTSGSPAAQTINAAWQKLTGTSAGLRTALMLTGSNASAFAKSAGTIKTQAGSASGGVAGLAAIQSTLSFKTAQAKTAVENTGIAIGMSLLPAVTSLMQAVTRVVVPIAAWVSKNQGLTSGLIVGAAALAGTIAVIAVAAKAYKAVTGAVGTVQKAAGAAGKALQKLGVLSKQSADTQAAAADASAAEQEADAEEVAAVNDEAAAESSGSWLAAMGRQIASAATWVAQSAVKVATVVASNVAAAATTAAGWAASAAGMIAQGAVWVATNVAKIAVVVGANIAGALAAAAAWVAANAVMLLGIGLVIAAVAAAVYLIVSHWSQIVAGVKKAWSAVYNFISKIISDVIDFVKTHWVLIVAIFTGPLGLAVVEIVKHFDQIKAFASRIVSDVIGFVKSHWLLIVSILAGPLGLAVGLVVKYWGDIKRWFTAGVSDVLGIFKRLPSEMLSIGADVVRGIWSGISGAAGWLASKVTGFAGSILGDIGSAFGIGSPSRKTYPHGVFLGMGLGNGITASIPYVMAAAHRMAARVLGVTSGLSSRGPSIGSSLAASAAGPGGGYGAGGGITIVNDIHDNHIMSDADISKLASRVGKSLTAQLAPAGRKPRYP